MTKERARLQLPASCEPPGEDNPPQQAVWIIFGATGHMGRSLARRALAHNDKVTVVGRAQENTREQMEGWHSNALGMLCDVRVRETVEHVIKKSIEYWGRVDVIVKYVFGYLWSTSSLISSKPTVLSAFPPKPPR